MKMLTTRKIVAIFTAISLAFLQAVPTGVAATAPADQASATSVPTSEKPATDNGSPQASTPVVTQVPTTIDSLMNTGGISSAATSGTVASTIEKPAVVTATSENLTNDQLQARIDQLLEEARLLEEQAVAQTERASALNEQAAQMKRAADELMRRSQEETRTAQALTQQGQTLLLAANKEMAMITAREQNARKELALLRKMKPSRDVSTKIAALTAELAAIAKQKSAITRKISNAQAILQDAKKRQQRAAVILAEGNQRLQAASQLYRKSASFLAQAQALRAQVVSKVAQANDLKTKIIPPAVQAYVNQLRQALSWYQVLAVLIAGTNPPQYRVSVTPPDGSVRSGVSPVFQPGQLRSMSVIVGANGIFSRMEYAAFEGIQGVDAQLLYAGMMKLIQTSGTHHKFLPDNEFALLMMTQIHVSKAENGRIYFGNADGKEYVMYRDPADKSKVIVLPTAVQAYADQLQARLNEKSGSYRVGKPELQADGMYRVTVTDGKTYFVKPAGGLYQLSFKLSGDGKLDVLTLEAAYYSAGENLVLRGDASKLLVEAMGVCPQGQACTSQVISDIEKLTKLTQIAVTKVENGAIFYASAGKNYKAYREGAVVKVEEILPVPPETLALAKNILGSSVVRGAVRPATVKDNTITTDFYDAYGNLVGSMIHVALTSNPPDQWMNAQGQLIAEVRSDGAKTTYEYDSIGRLSVSKDYDASGVLISANNYTYQDVVPIEILQAAKAGLSATAWDGLMAALLDAGGVEMPQQSEDRKTTFWSWASASVAGKSYTLSRQSVDQNGQTTEQWNFMTQERLPMQAILDYQQPQLTANEQAQLNTALQDMTSPTAWTLQHEPSSGTSVWIWTSAADPAKSYSLSHKVDAENGTDEWHFTTLQQIVPVSVTVALDVAGDKSAAIDVSADGHVKMTLNGIVMEGTLDPATMTVNLTEGTNEYRLSFQRKDPADDKNIFLASLDWKSLRWTVPGPKGFWIYEASSATWDVSGQRTSSQQILADANLPSYDQYLLYESSEYLQTYFARRVGQDASFDSNIAWILANKPDFSAVYARFSQMIDQNKVHRIVPSRSTLSLDPTGANKIDVQVSEDWNAKITVDGKEFTAPINKTTMTAIFTDMSWNSPELNVYALTFAQQPGEINGPFYVQRIESQSMNTSWKEGQIWEARYDASGVLDPKSYHDAQIITSGSGKAVMYETNPPVLLEGNPAGDKIMRDFLYGSAIPGLMQEIRDYLGIVQ